MNFKLPKSFDNNLIWCDVSTASYHPQSNGMVERFHRQLKAAIMAHESPITWTITLPAVLLGARSAVKELLGRSAAEIVYVTTLRLPGKFSHKYNVDAHTDLDNYSDKLRLAMSRLRLCPPGDSTQNNIFQFPTIKPPNVQNNSNIAKGDQIVPDTTVKQTRVGRKIQTPARFVQMVHALVAPNDIYRGASRTSRNNHNL